MSPNMYCHCELNALSTRILFSFSSKYLQSFRVKSHDLSQDNIEGERKDSIAPEHEKSHSVSPLGAGLPLLQRLRYFRWLKKFFY